MSTLKTVYRPLLYTLPLFIAVVLYGYTVRLPFFLDDGAHFQILSQATGFEFWGNFPTFPFYRPVAFTIWKSYESLTGTFDPVAFHLLNVFCFGIAGVLTGQIVRRVLPPDLRLVAAVVAGVGVILFPFSYQAVAMVAALFHLTLAVGVTATLWLALLWLDDRVNYAGLFLCWLCAFVAIFSHENGVLLLPLLIGLIAVTYYRRLPTRRKLFLLLAPVTLLVALYLLLWLSFRPQAETGFTGGLDVALAALLQGVIYPVIVLIRPFVTGDMTPSTLLLLITAVIVLMGAVVLRFALDHDARRFVGYALGWYLLAILPAALFLSAGYVLGQLRLALFASLGGAMFWGVLAAILWQRSRLLVLIVLVGCVVISVEFLNMRRESFLNLAEYNDRLLDSLHQYEASGAVLVNAPDFITPDEPDRRFLLGSEGVLFVDPTTDYNVHLSINSRNEYDDIAVIAYRSIQRSAGFGYSAHPPQLESQAVADVVQDASFVFVTQFDGDRFYPELVGGTQLDTLRDDDADAIYAGGDFALLDSALTITDGEITVETRWRVENPAPVKLFVHIYCDETFIAQSDGYPWGDTYPFQNWDGGEVQTDRRMISVDAAQACLRAYTGLYYEVDATRLEAVDATTSGRLENDQYLIE